MNYAHRRFSKGKMAARVLKKIGSRGLLWLGGGVLLLAATFIWASVAIAGWLWQSGTDLLSHGSTWLNSSMSQPLDPITIDPIAIDQGIAHLKARLDTATAEQLLASAEQQVLAGLAILSPAPTAIEPDDTTTNYPVSPQRLE